MAILTKAQVSKGTSSIFSISKNDLLALIPSGNYFEDIANWSKIMLHYQSSDKSQNIVVAMDASIENPNGKFIISETALDNFEIVFVILLDFDGGRLEIPRSSLPTSEFDVSILPPTLLTTRNFAVADAEDVFEGVMSRGEDYLSIPAGSGAYKHQYSFPQNGSGAYTLKIYVKSNTLARDVEALGLQGAFQNNFAYQPDFTNEHTFVSDQVISVNIVSGSGSGGLFHLRSNFDTESPYFYTGELRISKIELYQGFNQ